jgi:antitoxin component of MazEF toxin-antitoxin module
LALVLSTAAAMAIPAKPGLWKTLKLSDGTEVRAQLRGDEHVHFWMTEDGRRLMMSDNVLKEVDETQILSRMAQRKAPMSKAGTRKAPRKVGIGDRTHYVGKKKGLVILAQYQDVKFKTANNLAKYKRILNEEGYSVGEFQGSVADYFKAQSRGLFELEFDVVGPYTMANKRSYYGGNDSDDNDKNPEAMIVEACKAADAEVNFKDYDWGENIRMSADPRVSKPKHYQ